VPSVIPVEMVHGAMQLVVYFVTFVGVVLGFMLSGRG